MRTISYPAQGNDLCFSVEDESFWFVHRNLCILETMERLPPPGTFYDIGGGNGYVARAIQNSGREVVLVEPGAAGVRNAMRRGVRHIVRGTLDDAGFPPDSLPAVGLFDVVEHIPDDTAFLADIHRLLAPGGRVYITVPAYRWLWSHEDIQAGHARRYTQRTLGELLRKTGYAVEFATYFFSFLPLPILIQRALPYRLGMAAAPTNESIQSDHQIASPTARRLLHALTDWEVRRIRRGRTLPWGGSCLVVARRS